ncbi:MULTISPECIES: HAD-IIA family hydrolase [Aeromicrobium]|uniref:HAD-IIA family hydrolase n=1 Tax=Aeromicrobium yanjiei TaxID=2662028 RepID=A0A5Q2MIP0_9ACTN|nr:MULTISPECIES: HAD-IIA family hydrolase [Aeromicrobium]MRK01594.1 HAD-IIA family hydrolase [Aeromicrobium sp. S22]QGG41639.1 HAD-IIA family hydrolase [Aeromicrobium yanjiei]
MTSTPQDVLGSTTRELGATYDLAMLDLDGVVYLGADPVPGAADALRQAREGGIHLAYITNNASRPALAVAKKLREMDMPELADEDVVTAGQAVAHLVADALPAGSAVLVVGGEGLRVPLEERGLRCVASLDDGPSAVVQGFHGDIGWAHLAEAAYAIQSGLPWYVSNTDLTVPTPRGIAPGNGSLVQAVRNATGAEPIVAGKPERALFDETLARVGGRKPLMVGDRLDTDIDGAINAGIDSLVVLTGVSSLAEVAAARPGHRPTFVSADLRGLVEVHREVQVAGDGRARCGAAVAEVHDGVIGLVGGEAGSTDALRAVVALAWDAADRSDVQVVLDGTLDT